jgi:hypothetical protein
MKETTGTPFIAGVKSSYLWGGARVWSPVKIYSMETKGNIIAENWDKAANQKSVPNNQ